MFTEPEANNCFSINFRGEYQGLQNNGLKHRRNCSFSYTYAAIVLMINLHVLYIDWQSIYSSSSAVKQTSETLGKINSSGTFVLSLLTSFTVVIIA